MEIEGLVEPRRIRQSLDAFALRTFVDPSETGLWFWQPCRTRRLEVKVCSLLKVESLIGDYFHIKLELLRVKVNQK